jgi:hypothetical protein
VICTERHERTAQRQGYRNGCRQRNPTTQVGATDLLIPIDRRSSACDKCGPAASCPPFWSPAIDGDPDPSPAAGLRLAASYRKEHLVICPASISPETCWNMSQVAIRAWPSLPGAAHSPWKTQAITSAAVRWPGHLSGLELLQSHRAHERGSGGRAGLPSLPAAAPEKALEHQPVGAGECRTERCAQ